MQFFTNDKFTFALLYSWLLEAEWSTEIKETDKMVFAKLLVRYRGSYANKWSDEEGVYIYYTLEQIADDCNISVSTAKRSMTNLQKQGYISKAKKGSKANRIYITNPIIPDKELLAVYKYEQVGSLAPVEDAVNTYYINDQVIINDIGGIDMISCIANKEESFDYSDLFMGNLVDNTVDNPVDDMCIVSDTGHFDSTSEVILNQHNLSEVNLNPNYYTSIKSIYNYSDTNNKSILSSNTNINNTPERKTLLSDTSKINAIKDFEVKAKTEFFTQCHIGEDAEERNALAKFIVNVAKRMLCTTHPIAYKKDELSSVDIDILFENISFDVLEEVLCRVYKADMKHPFSYIRSTIIDVLMAGESAFYNHTYCTEPVKVVRPTDSFIYSDTDEVSHAAQENTVDEPVAQHQDSEEVPASEEESAEALMFDAEVEEQHHCTRDAEWLALKEIFGEKLG